MLIFIYVLLAILALFISFLFGMVVTMYAIVFVATKIPDKWENNFIPLMLDMRKWVQDGNSLRKYPNDRAKEILNK